MTRRYGYNIEPDFRGRSGLYAVVRRLKCGAAQYLRLAGARTRWDGDPRNATPFDLSGAQMAVARYSPKVTP